MDRLKIRAKQTQSAKPFQRALARLAQAQRDFVLRLVHVAMGDGAVLAGQRRCLLQQGGATAPRHQRPIRNLDAPIGRAMPV